MFGLFLSPQPKITQICPTECSARNIQHLFCFEKRAAWAKLSTASSRRKSATNEHKRKHLKGESSMSAVKTVRESELTHANEPFAIQNEPPQALLQEKSQASRPAETLASPALTETRLRLLIGGGALYSIVFWWLSTAAIIYFNFQPAYRATVFSAALILMLGAIYMLYTHRQSETVMGAFITFTAGSIIWAFVEVSFYTGYIVGPQVRPIFTVGPSVIGFFKAIHRSLYHEGLVLGLVVLMLLLSIGAKINSESIRF
ncbi:MAG: hypothetical protein CMR00_12120 [[Chlorobium] sp. 445]|nr:MAG: hypothetical protein CMR00_12120 [[Chlorobium] sp. 445]